MTTTTNPNAAHRDGVRETGLLDLGIDTEVHHHADGTVTITMPVRKLDQMIANGIEGADHWGCGEFDHDDLADARADGYDQAIADIKKLEEAKAS